MPTPVTLDADDEEQGFAVDIDHAASRHRQCIKITSWWSCCRVGLGLTALSCVSIVLLLVFKRPPIPPNKVLAWRPAECFVRRSYSDDQIQIKSDVIYGSDWNPFTGAQVQLMMDIYSPPKSDSRATRPLVLLMHGGSYTGGSKTGDSVPMWARVLASRGYVAASINYRLAPVSIALLENSTWQVVNMAQEDARAAVRYLRSRAQDFRIDTGRVMVAGDSAGGIAAMWYGYIKNATEGHGGKPHESSAVNAVMAISGSLKSQAFCESLDTDLRPKGCRMNSPPGPDYTSEVSPGDVPLLMLHGTQDKVVPYVDAFSAVERAVEVGVRSLLISVANGGHVPMEQGLDEKGPYLQQWLHFASGALNLADAECPPGIFEQMRPEPAAKF